MALSIGDRVLVANKGSRGKPKLADKWEPDVYTVVDSKPSLHIYKVEDSDGNQRVLHRNLLLPVNFLPLSSDADVTLSEADECASPSASLYDAHLSDLSSEDAWAPTVADLPCQDGSVTDRTSSWVAEQSVVQEDVHQSDVAGPGSPNSDVPPDSALDGSAGGVVGPTDVAEHATPITLPNPSHNTDTHYTDHSPPLTSRFGRVLRPVCRLIESMTQLQTILGEDDALGHVIHV